MFGESHEFLGSNKPAMEIEKLNFFLMTLGLV